MLAKLQFSKETCSWMLPLELLQKMGHYSSLPKDRFQISLLILSEFQRINYLLFPLKSSGPGRLLKKQKIKTATSVRKVKVLQKSQNYFQNWSQQSFSSFYSNFQSVLTGRLTLLWRRSLSYRNQATNLQSKSMY